MPDKNIFHDRKIGSGLLKYRFTSWGRLLAEGYTHEPNRHHLGLKQGITSINLLVFELPFPGAFGDLDMELEVVEPFNFLKPYSGKINCKINPDYSAKFGKCYNENLMLSH
ncbi:hypothetical protein [uncultured Pseudodesulfovibrio sp.]|uniref:hypothetical protein n=1 Tax=uncultured Pseudodesulfovibrio sp. TaxID=2035858 RepID=UPI0029C8CE28|nr:hypothetical protein [uncultured Pseudodesulfovibrio sp.]